MEGARAKGGVAQIELTAAIFLPTNKLFEVHFVLKCNVAICSIVRLMMMMMANGEAPPPSSDRPPPLVLHPDGSNGKRLQQSGQNAHAHTHTLWPALVACNDGHNGGCYDRLRRRVCSCTLT